MLGLDVTTSNAREAENMRLPRFTADKTATVTWPSMVPPIDASTQSPRDKTA